MGVGQIIHMDIVTDTSSIGRIVVRVQRLVKAGEGPQPRGDRDEAEDPL